MYISTYACRCLYGSARVYGLRLSVCSFICIGVLYKYVYVTVFCLRLVVSRRNTLVAKDEILSIVSRSVFFYS